VILSDGLYFKSDHYFDTETKDHLSSLFHERIKQQAKEAEETAEQKQLCEIFEFDEHIALNENIPGVNMSFLDRLFHQLTRSPPPEVDYLSDDVFEDVSPREITTVVNENTDIDGNNAKDDSSILENLCLFIDDLNEETNVIRGLLDENIFLSRRSRRAKLSHLSIDNTQITSF
jgi:hypothetical protein